MRSCNKIILLNESSLQKLLMEDFRLVKAMYPLAKQIYKNIYNFLKENYFDRGLQINHDINFQPISAETLKRFNKYQYANRPMYVVGKYDPRSTAYAAIENYQQQGYWKLYVNLYKFTTNSNSMDAMIDSLAHELTHLTQKVTSWVNPERRKNTRAERNVTLLYALFNDSELEARANQGYSFYFNHPQYLFKFINEFAQKNNGQLSLKGILNEMIETIKYSILYITQMESVIKVVEEECRESFSAIAKNPNESMVLLIANDLYQNKPIPINFKTNYNLISKSDNDFKNAANELAIVLEKKLAEYQNFIRAEFKNLIISVINKYYNKGNQ